MEQTMVIDRFEESFAVCELPDGSFADFPRSLLPAGAKEGDCLVFREGVWTADPEETARRRERSRALLNRLTARPDRRRAGVQRGLPGNPGQGRAAEKGSGKPPR